MLLTKIGLHLYGENVDQFEKELSSYVGIKSATALSSGTAAIHLGLKALGVGKGDIVFCQSLTFSASCNPIVYEGATPVFIDSEYETWNMDPKALEKAFEKYTPKAVVVVHLYGTPAKMDEIIEICHKHHVPILEDAAESLGATYHKKQTGTFGDYGVYSFNGNKIITTSGGGMLVSNNEEGIQKAHFWATQSREKERFYEHKEIGYNYRLSNICAGIGRGQLKVLDERIAEKKAIYERYQNAFQDIKEIKMQPYLADSVPNFWLSAMILDQTCSYSPLQIIESLEASQIESRHIWKPMHLQPFYHSSDFITLCESSSVAEDIFKRGLCLPSDTKMTIEDQNRVILKIRNLFT